MGFVNWIIAGALLGGGASALIGLGYRRGFALNVATGIAGVTFGGWLLGMVIGTSAFSPGEFSLASLLVSLMGTAVLLTILHEFRGLVAGQTPTRQNETSAAFGTSRIGNRNQK